MAINQKQVLQAVYDAMFDALTTTPPTGGGRPILPRASTYLSLAIPGNPVDVSQFANPWSPGNLSGSVAAAENFATLVDPVPLLSPSYGVGGVSTDRVYGEIVRANVAPPPPDPAGEAAYQKAFNLLFIDGVDYDDQGAPVTVKVDSPLYRNYKNKSVAYAAAMTSYLTIYLQYDLSNPDDARKWAILAPTLQTPVDLAWRDLQAASPGVVENALATLGQYQQSSLAGIFSRARQTYDSTVKASVFDPNFRWHLCEAFPGNWFAESAAANFAQQTIQSTRLRINENSRFSSYGAGGGVNFGLWRIGGGASTERRQYDLSTATSNLTVSFRYARVEIRRRWLDSSLMSLRGWSTAGRRPGDYSSGDADKNDGVYPLLPTGFIVARDIKISANWSTSDLQLASQATSATVNAGWGPFSLSGSYQNSSSTRRFKSGFDGTTLTVPGVQIVGWLSSVNPYAPPIGGPPSISEDAVETALEATGRTARRNSYALPYLASDVASADGAAITRGPGDRADLADLEAQGHRPSNGEVVYAEPPSLPAEAVDVPQSVFVSAEE